MQLLDMSLRCRAKLIPLWTAAKGVLKIRAIGPLPFPVALLAVAVVVQYLLVATNAVRDDADSWWHKASSFSDRVVVRTTHELVERFSNYGYSLIPGHPAKQPVPRVLLAELPRDWGTGWTTEEKKSAFIAVMLPIVLAENARVEALRRRLMQNDVGDAGWRGDLARSYGLDTADSGSLLGRIDKIPPSLVIAQAAIESGWGRSRFAREGNAMFGQWTWRAAQGMKPKDRAEGATHYVRAFPDISASVRAYMKNLNIHPAYRGFRALREKLRRHNKDLSGLRLAETLDRYSIKGAAYVQDVLRIIRREKLTRFDSARLADRY